MAKYDDLLASLDNDELYSAGKIVQMARLNHQLTAFSDLLRLRINLNARATQGQFPDEGDGWVKLPGQGPVPGWFGWRWKGLIGRPRKKREKKEEA